MCSLYGQSGEMAGCSRGVERRESGDQFDQRTIGCASNLNHFSRRTFDQQPGIAVHAQERGCGWVIDPEATQQAVGSVLTAGQAAAVEFESFLCQFDQLTIETWNLQSFADQMLRQICGIRRQGCNAERRHREAPQQRNQHGAEPTRVSYDECMAV
ncbi:MAG: hypothetical protein EBY28_01140 [Betaproteobacteria bacterium]|nr:hypothetical protein [Betaproteobacteria bacterium]